jgi:hypothetical protein
MTNVFVSIMLIPDPILSYLRLVLETRILELAINSQAVVLDVMRPERNGRQLITQNFNQILQILMTLIAIHPNQEEGISAMKPNEIAETFSREVVITLIGTSGGAKDHNSLLILIVDQSVRALLTANPIVSDSADPVLHPMQAMIEFHLLDVHVEAIL